MIESVEKIKKMDTRDIKLRHIQQYIEFGYLLDRKNYELPKHLLHTATTQDCNYSLLKKDSIVVLYKDNKMVSIEIDKHRRPFEGVDYIIYPVVDHPFDIETEYILLDPEREIK